MADVILKLGEVVFDEAEIPEHIPVSTKHQHVIHKLIGGKRSIDMLGADHQPIKWSGWLLGSNALDRFFALKGYIDQGLAVQLSWSQYQYKVVIVEFQGDYERDYQIPYEITCAVVQDYNNPDDSDGAPSIDSSVKASMGSAASLASSVGDSGIMSAVSAVKSAISTVSNFATAAKGVITSVLTPIAQARAQVQTLIASTENTLQSVTTLGGVLPNNPVATNVARLSSQINAMTNQTNLVQLDSTLGGMGTNIGALNTGVKSVQAVGGSLFDLASKYYGNVAGWATLSAANPQLGGDSNISAPTSIVVPPAPPAAVMNAAPADPTAPVSDNNPIVEQGYNSGAIFFDGVPQYGGLK